MRDAARDRAHTRGAEATTVTQINFFRVPAKGGARPDTKPSMPSSDRPRFAWVALGLVLGCAPDGAVVGKASDGGGSGGSGGGGEGSGTGSDPLPRTDGALSGSYDLDTYTMSCHGDCSAQATLGPISYCDVGHRDSDYIRVEDDHGTLRMDLTEGRLEGPLADDGSFTLTGEGTEDGGAIVIKGQFDGVFTGRHEGFGGTISFTVEGSYGNDPVDCQGQLEVTGTWNVDDCQEDPTTCPAEYPLCVHDGCYAGGDGDPCFEDTDCGSGFVCFDNKTCRAPAAVGGDCLETPDCADGLVCYQKACQAGTPGDPCDVQDDCTGGAHCVANVCTAGNVGDPCTSGDDCQTQICVNQLCSAGKTGDPCTFGDDCQSGICYEHACSDGAAGDACTFDDDCATGLVCSAQTCAPG